MTDHLKTERRGRERRRAILKNGRELFNKPTTPGIVLMICTALALIAANSGIAHTYHRILDAQVSVGLGALSIAKPIHHWINDGLMAIFFFAIGLEIKRELLIGQLSSIRRSALPIIGALGGMIAPAVIYTILNAGGPGSHGWGIPTATDIAFALGVLTLLGDRVPSSLKVFLLALAIADDLGAVIVIAIFYTETIFLVPLLVAVVGWLVAIGLNVSKVRAPFWYGLVGIIVWGGMLQSGIHATIAGVLMGFAIPVRTLYDGPTWLNALESSIARYRKMLDADLPDSNEELGIRQEIVHRIEVATERAQSPLIRLEHGLAPWVSYFIMPIFALANAAVEISGESFGNALSSSVSWGIFLGLFFGKQIGVFLFSWLAVRLGIATMPGNTRWKQFYGVSILAGIGFTMSLFVTELSFRESLVLTETAKISVLAASLLAGATGYLWLAMLKRKAVRIDRTR